MNDETKIKNAIRHTFIQTHPDADRQFKDNLMDTDRRINRPPQQNRMSFWTALQPGPLRAAVTIIVLMAAAFSAYVFWTRSQQPTWTVNDSISALQQVDSVVLKSTFEGGNDMIVHAKGSLYNSHNVAVRYESQDAVRIYNNDTTYLYSKDRPAFNAAHVYEKAPVSDQPISPSANYTAMLFPIKQDSRQKSLKIDEVTVKQYYVVTGTLGDSNIRMRSIIDARTNLPVSTTYWRPEDGTVLLASEVLEYNADIPQSLFEFDEIR